MGKGFNIFVQLLVIRGIHDTQCGFKLFETNSIQRIISKIVVYKNTRFTDAYTGAFDVELLYLARKLKIKVCEVPIDWHHVKTNRVSPVKDSLRMFADIFKIRLYSFLGKYES
jgi:dolichyl-phosphate beta-glucosyltransferase